MAFFDWLFGDDDPAPVTYTQSTNTSLPPYITEASERAVGEAERLAGLPYTPYESPRIAGLTPDQEAAFTGVREGMGIGSDRASLAYMMGIGSGAPISQTEIQNYMNPYIQNVAGVAERRLDERAAQQRVADRAGASVEGALGGSRQGIVDALRSRDLERNVGDIYTQATASGYESAIANLMNQRQLQQSAALAGGQLGAQEQNLRYQDINTQLGIGGLLQENQQRALNLGYEDFMKQQNYPWEQVNRLSGVIQGMPYNASTVTTSEQAGTPTAGFFQQAAGLGIAGLGTAGNLGWRPLG